jgi:hypothetical protein
VERSILEELNAGAVAIQPGALPTLLVISLSLFHLPRVSSDVRIFPAPGARVHEVVDGWAQNILLSGFCSR